MDLLANLLPGWSQGQANNLVVLLVFIVVAVLALRVLLRAFAGVLFFRMRRIIAAFLLSIAAFLLSVAGGVPLAGMGGIDSLAGVGGSLRQGLCNTSYAAAAWMNDASVKPVRYVGRTLYANTSQLCGMF